MQTTDNSTRASVVRSPLAPAPPARRDHVLFETDAGGSTKVREYIWGLGTDDLVAIRIPATGDTLYAVKDQLGSIRAWVTRAGTWRWGGRYRPYGVQAESRGTAPDVPYSWTGREYDPETGFYFLRARYYDPTVGRFTQEDPIGFAGGSNLYAYVEGQPLEARDPSGMISNYLYGGGPNMVAMADERFRQNELNELLWDQYWIERGGAYGRSIDPRWQAYLLEKAAPQKVDPNLVGMDCPDPTKCPGGLTNKQYDKINEMIDNTAELLRFQLHWMLDHGYISFEPLGRRGAAKSEWFSGRIVLDPILMGNAPGNGAFELAHELFHQKTLNIGGVPGEWLADQFACRASENRTDDYLIGGEYNCWP